jgi:transaldolase
VSSVAEILGQFTIKVFADGADREGIVKMAAEPWVRGFTTNPTLMRKAGIEDYESFARDVLADIGDLPISFEVFSDDQADMERQAKHIAEWGENVYVKVPVTTTQGEFCGDLIHRLAEQGVSLNVTALMGPRQVEAVNASLVDGVPAIISVFAGRVADTGRDPVPLMSECLGLLQGRPGIELLWASPREVLNLVQADQVGCHIITMTNDLLAKLGSLGKDLDQFSLETVRMFREDAIAAGFEL